MTVGAQLVIVTSVTVYTVDVVKLWVVLDPPGSVDTAGVETAGADPD